MSIDGDTDLPGAKMGGLPGPTRTGERAEPPPPPGGLICDPAGHRVVIISVGSDRLRERGRGSMSSSTKPPVTQIGKFQILQHVATGGMGTVYKARDTETNRIVALKVLSPDFATNPVLVERFLREAKHAGKLSHRNIVEFY